MKYLPYLNSILQKPGTVKLTRDAELDMDNDVAQSLLEQISKGVAGRKTGQPVRFVFDNSIAKDLLDYIINHLALDEAMNLIPGGRYIISRIL
jgi:polyphosphate kinase